MLKIRLQELFDKNNGIIKELKKKWEDFLENKTYLVHNNKKDNLETLKRISKYPWHYILNFKLAPQIKNIKKEINNLKNQIQNYNDQFVNNRLISYNSFFTETDDNLKYPLDEDQRIAVIKDDKHNLIIAGAGSGKTSVIASRIAYLIRRKDSIDKNRILALAFTKNAAKEMEERIKDHYGFDIDIFTFHALGRKIIQEETNKTPRLLFDQKFDYNQYLLIQQFFDKSLEKEEFADLVVKYITYYIEQELDEESFLEKEEYYKYMRNKKYSTLNNIEVKSIAERDIGNFLFINQINFEYEPLVDWIERDENEIKENSEIEDYQEEKEYHPDFYLPDYDIYIEHWGLNEKNKIPPWFSISSEVYLEIKKWKLSQFKKHQKILIETFDYERKNNQLLPNLKNYLIGKDANIKFTPLSYKELIEKTHQFKVKKDELLNLITNFIKISKANFYKVENIAKKIESKGFSKKQRLFGKIAIEIFKKYQDHLIKMDKIDFNDMINNAVDLINKNPEKYQNMYDHLLVDEFQDISYQRLQLIKGFVNDHSDTKLFCVGDDWQSIYQFTGSDVRFFTNFGEYFTNPEITNLKTNYRSTVKIVDMSNELIGKNKEQIRKEIVTINDLGQQPLFFELSRKSNYSTKSQIPHIYNLIKKLMDEGVKPNDIMVLSRFNRYLKDIEIYCGAREIPTEYKAKGVRFLSAHSSKGSECQHVILTDITTGLYGFPCEIQDSSVMELAKRFKTQKFIEEERRLFYVALTRSKKFLYLFSLENANSVFLDEIKPHITKIFVENLPVWDQLNSQLIPNYLKEQETSRPIICPECGKILKERDGKNGKFLGCSGYPQCKYTYDLKKRLDIYNLPKICPECKNKLRFLKGPFGDFIGCSAFPDCRYTIDLAKKISIFCPKCNKVMRVRKGPYKPFLGCSNYPKCKFTYNLN